MVPTGTQPVPCSPLPVRAPAFCKAGLGLEERSFEGRPGTPGPPLGGWRPGPGLPSCGCQAPNLRAFDWLLTPKVELRLMNHS